MKGKASLHTVIAGMVINDQLPVEPHSGRFAMQDPNWLPTRPFTKEEIEAARSTIPSAEDAEDD